MRAGRFTRALAALGTLALAVAVPCALAQRGYWAVGGEWMLPLLGALVGTLVDGALASRRERDRWRVFRVERGGDGLWSVSEDGREVGRYGSAAGAARAAQARAERRR